MQQGDRENVNPPAGPDSAEVSLELSGDPIGFGEGIISGLLGAAAVALWFFVFDLVRGEPLFTPAALGSVVFYGAEGVGQVQIDVTTVLGYTALHFAAFGALGAAVSAALSRAGKVPHLLLGGILLFVALEALFLGALTIVAEFLLGNLAWWTVAIGNLLAVLVMGGFFALRHPGLWSTLFQARRGLEYPNEM